MNLWEPIETAPKDDYATLDLWVGKEEAACRMPDCWWDVEENCWRDRSDKKLVGLYEPTHWMYSPPPNRTSAGSVLADLKRAFLRQSAQVKAYREKRDEELNETNREIK